MDKVTEFVTNYRNIIYIVVAVIVILVIMYFCMRRTPAVVPMIPMMPMKPMQDSETFEGHEMAQGTREPVKIILFYAPWCPHCKQMMSGDDSLWEQLKRKHQRRKGLTFGQINCDEQADLATKYGVKEFPTILKFNKDKIEQFEGDRTMEAIESFIDSA